MSLEIFCINKESLDREEPQVLICERPRLKAYLTMLGVMGKPVINHVATLEQIKGRLVNCRLCWIRHTDLKSSVEIG